MYLLKFLKVFLFVKKSKKSVKIRSYDIDVVLTYSFLLFEIRVWLHEIQRPLNLFNCNATFELKRTWNLKLQNFKLYNQDQKIIRLMERVTEREWVEEVKFEMRSEVNEFLILKIWN